MDYNTFCIIFCIFFWVLCAIAVVLAMAWVYIQLQYYKWNKDDRMENVIVNRVKNEIYLEDEKDECEENLD